jgi:hypothetical protein
MATRKAEVQGQNPAPLKKARTIVALGRLDQFEFEEWAAATTISIPSRPVFERVRGWLAGRAAAGCRALSFESTFLLRNPLQVTDENLTVKDHAEVAALAADVVATVVADPANVTAIAVRGDLPDNIAQLLPQVKSVSVSVMGGHAGRSAEAIKAMPNLTTLRIGGVPDWANVHAMERYLVSSAVNGALNRVNSLIVPCMTDAMLDALILARVPVETLQFFDCRYRPVPDCARLARLPRLKQLCCDAQDIQHSPVALETLDNDLDKKRFLDLIELIALPRMRVVSLFLPLHAHFISALLSALRRNPLLFSLHVAWVSAEPDPTIGPALEVLYGYLKGPTAPPATTLSAKSGIGPTKGRVFNTVIAPGTTALPVLSKMRKFFLEHPVATVCDAQVDGQTVFRYPEDLDRVEDVPADAVVVARA